jgi:hypothetical protein
MTQAFVSFNRLPGLVLFGVLALLPSLAHLTWQTLPATQPLLALGPVVAGFGVAARFVPLRAGFLALGPLVAGLIWTANWLMMAGSTCCSTIN